MADSVSKRVKAIHAIVGKSQIAITSRDREFLESVQFLNVLSPTQNQALVQIEAKAQRFVAEGKPT